MQFNVTRGVPIKDNPSTDVRTQDKYPNVIRIEGLADDPPWDQTIVVESFGEKPDLVSYVYALSDGGSVIMYAEGEVCTESAPDASLVITEHDEPAESFLMGPAEYGEQLEAILALGAEGDPKTNAQRFFADMDQQSMPNLFELFLPDTEATERTLAVGNIGGTLSWRVRERLATMGPTGSSCPHFTDEVHPDDLGRIQDVSDLMLDLAREYFGGGAAGDPHGGIDIAKFARAFELFANGDLRVQLPSKAWTTEPSSGFYFFFGELALFARDHAEHCTEANVWDELAPVLIRTQTVFAKVYAPTPADEAKLMDYRSCNYKKDRRLTDEELETIRIEFTGATHEDLCIAAGKNAVAAFPGYLT